VDAGSARLLLEFRPIDQQLKHGARRATGPAAAGQPRADPQPGARDQESARRHPRLGATARARTDQPELREYTQVIINEADRLQDLMNRLLTRTA
jgi:two-component system nitrogen regulation sensor histidine kinase GlnL